MRTGYYHYNYGYPFSRTTNGYWWSDASYSNTDGRSLGTFTSIVLPQDNKYRGLGFAIRCTIRVE